MKNQKIALTAVSLAATMMLAACGGGGGGGSSAATPSSGASAPSTQPTGGSVGLQTNVAAANYATGTMQANVFTQLNAYRLAMGVGQLAQDTILDTSAQAHALYLNSNFANGNITAVTHNEVSTFANFYEVTPLSRAQKAGAPVTEFISENAAVGLAQSAPNLFASDCLGQYLNTVYHLQGATYTQQTMGIGFQQNTSQGTYSCVLDFGQTAGVVGAPIANGASTAGGQEMAITAIAHSPLSNETAVATVMTAESPNPAPDVSAPGRPIMVRVTANQAGDALTVSTFTLTSAAGVAVPARIIVPNAALTGSTGATADVNSELAPGVAFLLPLAPLAANTSYNVSFAGARNGTPMSTAWSFTTGAH